MSIEGLIISMIMAGLSLFWLALPMLRRNLKQSHQSRQRLEQLTAYERVLATVRDLDEDYQVGKISQEQYATERAHWLERGVILLEMLDQPVDDQRYEEYEAANPQDDPVERAIAAYMQVRGS